MRFTVVGLKNVRGPGFEWVGLRLATERRFTNPPVLFSTDTLEEMKCECLVRGIHVDWDSPVYDGFNLAKWKGE